MFATETAPHQYRTNIGEQQSGNVRAGVTPAINIGIVSLLLSELALILLALALALILSWY